MVVILNFISVIFLFVFFVWTFREVEATASWGGQLELGALAQALKKHIVVYSASGPDVEMGKEYVSENLILRISFHRHAFGLGEHYNSVVPVPLR